MPHRSLCRMPLRGVTIRHVCCRRQCLPPAITIFVIAAVCYIRAIEYDPKYADSSCDDECSRFRRQFNAWPRGRPRAAIVMLLQRKSLPFFRRSMDLFHNNSNSEYRYPIIIFHEADLDTKPGRDLFRALTPDPVLLYFQRVTFEIPSFVNQSAVPRIAC